MLGWWRCGVGWGLHCIVPAHVLSIKAAAAHFAALCLAALCSVLLGVTLIMLCWSFIHQQEEEEERKGTRSTSASRFKPNPSNSFEIGSEDLSL